MTDPLDPRLTRALDAFTVPDLPGDFADRMVALAMAGDEAAPAAIPPVTTTPPPRRRLRLWLGGMALAGAGFASFSAAAMGYFGEPLRNAVHRVPIVHRLVERLAPRHHHPLVGQSAPVPPAAAVTPTPAAVVPATAPIVPAAQPLPPGPGAGLRRAAAAAAIWQARHPDAPLPRRFAVPPGAIRAGHPWATPAAGGQRLRMIRERRAARALGALSPASPAPAMVAPAAAPVVNVAPARVGAPAGAAARPWRWWEQTPGEPLRRGRGQRRQIEGATASTPAAPQTATPAVERPEARPAATESPHPKPAPRAHPPRVPRAPRARTLAGDGGFRLPPCGRSAALEAGDAVGQFVGSQRQPIARPVGHPCRANRPRGQPRDIVFDHEAG